MNSKVERSKHFAATWLYRWQLSTGILGAVFSALTFAGVFTLLLGPVLQDFGFGYSSTLLFLLGIVVVLFFALGTLLDRVIKFWAAQTLISTVRNPFLISKLYQKEALVFATQHIPVMKALRILLAKHGEDTRFIDEGITRLEETLKNKEWSISPDEWVYDTPKI